jgi:CRISPR-associated protein Csm3
MKRLKKIYEITGTLKLLTGLHVGAGKDEVKIGGVDSSVIKNPLTGEPYIPGSSLKGKMRMLLELATGSYQFDGKDAGDVLTYSYYKAHKNDRERLPDPEAAKNILKLFGTSGSDYKDLDKLPEEEKKEIAELAITRLSFYDLFLEEESREKYYEVLERRLEEKTEVKINRITGTVHGRNLNTKERIPAGMEFSFRLILKVFDCDDEEALKEMVRRGLELLEFDSLGGSGSRGYGKVRVKLNPFNEINPLELGKEKSGEKVSG